MNPLEAITKLKADYQSGQLIDADALDRLIEIVEQLAIEAREIHIPIE